MCGIAGKINFNNRPVSLTEIKSMTDAIAHRGPDDEGQWVEGNVGLGNRRLAIIDLSAKGHMPMLGGRGRYVITFNGEIYNFQTEKRKLGRRGYHFRSSSDTEVILALYQEYGVKCLKHLRGMFAFAIWDRKERTLFAARDRLGKKPFKYYHDDNKLIFGSELKAILTQDGIIKSPDYKAIYHYLSFQYVPSPYTGFLNIRKLPPAHYLLLKDGVLSVHQYWQLDYTKKLDLSEAEWCDRIIAKLNQSVKLRLISDVPLGAFLSGGVDSSAVVAFMSLNSNKPVKTFSIGFKEEQFNELPFARLVADRYATEHTEFIIEPKAIEILPQLIASYEEPYADSSAIPSFYVSQLAHQHVTVALNGDGGDENFAGYGWYPFFGLSESNLVNRIPDFFYQGSLSAFKTLSQVIPHTLLNRASRFSQSLSEKDYQRYLRYICYFTEEEKARLVKKDFYVDHINQDSRDILFERFNSTKATHPIDKALGVDVISYLSDDLLVKMDIATMSNSLEGRSPLLDHEFMELIASMPAELKIKRFIRKYIFKKALGPYLPKEILYRPKKGFAVPLQQWIKNELRSLIHDTLLNKNAKTAGFLDQKRIRNILSHHQETHSNQASQIWALLTLELWMQRNFH